MKASNAQLIVIVGPTASGKSDLAVRLAKKYGGEIISADSRQVYKGLDIGSGKITKKEMCGIPHHLLDVASSRSLFTVARYERLARKALRDIMRHGKIPIVVGGTGLYIDALLYDSTIPEVKPNMGLRARLEHKSAEELFAELKRKDPARANTIDAKNKRRLIRALEIIAATGKPVPPQVGKIHARYLSELGIQPSAILKIGIQPSHSVLRERIHKRLLARVKQGMIGEVKRLHQEGVSWKRLDDLGLEYRYVSRYLRNLSSRNLIAGSHREGAMRSRGDIPRDDKQEMLRELEKEIWHYSRRQMTWWRKDTSIQWQTTNK